MWFIICHEGAGAIGKTEVPFSGAEPIQWAKRHKSSIWTLFEPDGTEPL